MNLLAITNLFDSLNNLFTPQFLEGLLKVILLIGIVVIFRWVLFKILNRYISDPLRKYRVRKMISIIFFTVILVVIVYDFVSEYRTTFFAALGVISAGIAFTFRGILLDIMGWLFIISKNPVVVGDRIELDRSVGDIIDINLFQITILECGNWSHNQDYSGRLVSFPNSYIFTKTLANYTRKLTFIWDEINVSITTDSDWEHAMQIMYDVANDLSKDRPVIAQKNINYLSGLLALPKTDTYPEVYIKGINNQIELGLRYVCAPREMRKLQHEIRQRILEEFKSDKDISLIFRQTIKKPEKKPSKVITDLA
ncbi:MAG: mechanosensitive ion channel family protein [Hyphomicrobiales bacterium]